ncbi:MAG: hypothetical protein WDM81_04450 [Rhizomicrobium sp.]
MFRGVLTVLGGRTAPAPFPTAGQALPRYTILVPLYREANVLPRLARSLLLLDYPQASKDIKIIVEDDDAETATVAAEICRPRAVRTHPRPRLENSGRSRGLQLRPALCPRRIHRDLRRGRSPGAGPAAQGRRRLSRPFGRRRLPPGAPELLQRRRRLAAAPVHARLSAVVLLAAARPRPPRVPMPLGGTSNHFRTATLRELDGWDPFNVTEDADLGIRIAQLGKRVAMLDSTPSRKRRPRCVPG